MRADRLGDLRDLLHQLLVDRQPAGRVEDDDVAAVLASLVDSVAAHADGVLRAALGVKADVELLTEDLQLVDGRRPLQIRRYEHRPLALGLDLLGELRTGGGLTGTLQAGHQDDRRPGLT